MDFDHSEHDSIKFTTRDNIVFETQDYEPDILQKIIKLEKKINNVKKCLKMQGRRSIIIQKAIAVASMHQYYDIFDEILRDLYLRFSY